MNTQKELVFLTKIKILDNEKEKTLYPCILYNVLTDTKYYINSFISVKDTKNLALHKSKVTTDYKKLESSFENLSKITEKEKSNYWIFTGDEKSIEYTELTVNGNTNTQNSLGFTTKVTFIGNKLMPCSLYNRATGDRLSIADPIEFDDITNLALSSDYKGIMRLGGINKDSFVNLTSMDNETLYKYWIFEGQYKSPEREGWDAGAGQGGGGGGGGQGGTTDYNNLTNKPQINGVTLVGNKTSPQLNLVGTDDIRQTLDGNEQDKVPSVNAVKTYIQDNTLQTENDGVYDITKIGKYYELVKTIRLRGGVINNQEQKVIEVLRDTSIDIIHASSCIDPHSLLFSTLITSDTIKLMALNVGQTPIPYRSIDISLRILSLKKPNGGYVEPEPLLTDPKLGLNDEYGEDPYNPEDTVNNKAISTNKEIIAIPNSLEIPIELNGATYDAITESNVITIDKEDTSIRLKSVTPEESIVTVTFRRDGFLDKVRKLYLKFYKQDPDLKVTPNALTIIATQTGFIDITGTASWTAVSKDPAIATVDKPNGTGTDNLIVEGLKKGVTAIEIRVDETDTAVAKTFTVYVNIKGKDSDLIVNPDTITVEMGDTAKVTVTGTQPFTTDSENKGIATIDGDGNITPVSAGETNLYIKGTDNDIWNGKTVTIPCTVIKKTPNITINPPYLELEVGQQGEIFINGEPQQYTTKTLDTDIATITDTTVLGVKKGETKVIIETPETEVYKPFRGEMMVKVLNVLPDTIVNLDYIEIEKGEKGVIEVSQTKPASGWTSEILNTNIATANKNEGVGTETIDILGVEVGETTLVVKNKVENGFEDIVLNTVVKVIPSLYGVAYEGKVIQIDRGGTRTINIGSTNTVTLETKDTNIATVNGLDITGVNVGQTELYIKYNDIVIATATVQVNIKEPDTNINKTDIEIATTETGIVSVTHTKPAGGWTARIENTDIATVNTAEGTGNADLTITGIRAGTTKLIVESKDDPMYSKVIKECNVVIKDRTQLVFPNGDIVTTPGAAIEVDFQSDAELGDITAVLDDTTFGTVEIVQG